MSRDQPIVILPMKDEHVGLRVSKKDTFDLPMRLIIVGKSQLSGKSTLMGNILLRPYDKDDVGGQQMYKDDFDGEDIYVVCPSIDLDSKWLAILKGKSIPDTNVWRHYDETELEQWYEQIEKNFHQAINEGKKPKHVLLVLDDCSFSGDLKAKTNGILSRIASNGRHILISLICTAQKYSSISTAIRENSTGCIFFECTNKQLDLIMEDHANIPKKQFEKIFRDTTKERHSFMVINYSNTPDRRLMDHSFRVIGV